MKLTPAETRVLAEMARTGESRDEVAKALGLSRQTVAKHLFAAGQKLGGDNRLMTILIAMREGLIPCPCK